MIGPVGTGGVASARTVRLLPSGIELPQTIAPSEGSSDLKAATTPPIDQSRVSAIRTAIAQGTYQVDSARIAERMVSLDLPQE